ncbi:PREDICTED: leucine-rich PPR motif-containing protein, mitochondrial-like [Vollenhovia emeryi]|uniref:leucine-rich PPR motif-containing protein, mitochondrial-like n=1 Tax=Vollenhovia emeryi TaxID=411798 RepID=UPI0005F4FB78|nr:PREDICTED: leucine-rich PPR motif-containing protein, mitochondrial-like [Vollenhovia emeryi]
MRLRHVATRDVARGSRLSVSVVVSSFVSSVNADSTTMIEAEKMLQLKRYLTLVVRSQLRSPRCETARGRPLQRGGYVSGCAHSRSATLRPEIRVATCNRTYSTTVPQSSRSNVIDHKLTSFCDDVKKGRVSADHLREVIDLCSNNDYHLPHSTGLLLLKCCGNLIPDLDAAERDHLADQVWRLAKKSGGGLTLEYYHTLLGINAENSKLVNPKTFLANMSVEPDRNTYSLLMSVATKAGNSQYLWDILSIMKDRNMNIDEEAINALVHIYVTNGNIDEIKRTIKLMQEAKLSTAKACTELACGYTKLGDISNLVKTLDKEPQSNANLLRIIKTLSVSNNGRHIPVVLNLFVSSVATIEPEISKTIAELIRADRVEDAYTVINCFATNNVTQNVVEGFVNDFINELVILNAPIDDIVKYTNDFVDSGCSQHALTDAAEVGLKLGREKLCLTIFQVMRNRNIEIRPHYYWPLLLRAYHNEGEAEIFSLIRSMINEGVEVDSDTLLHYVLPYVNTADPVATLQKLLLNNVPASVSYTPLISFLLHRNRLHDVTRLYTNYTRYKVHYRELIKPLVRAYLATKDCKTCVTLFTAFPQGQDFVSLFLEALIKAEKLVRIDDLLFLLMEFKRCETNISQEDAILLKDTLKWNKNFRVTTKAEDLIDDLVDPKVKDSALKFHPRYMTTRELTYFLVELKSSKANTRNILHRLLFAHCVENNFKKAEEIQRAYEAHQYEWMPNTKSILFELYLKLNKLDEAEALLPDLQIVPNEYQLDKMKIVMYATALVKADRLTKAFNVIATFNATCTGPNAQAQCCTLLETLAQSQSHDHTKSMLYLLLQRNYCQKSVDLLRPLVAIPLERDNILGAVDALAECAQKYYKAPLVLDILIKLLKRKYSSKLPDASGYIEQVYDVATTIYSTKVANTFLAIALAKLNKTEKLQALLQTQNLSTNCLVYYISDARTNIGIDVYLNLFKVANANNLDENVMSDALLSACCIMGDCNSVLELWKVMCTKNIKPNAQFKENFIQCLSSHKVPLPPGMENENKSTINVN